MKKISRIIPVFLLFSLVVLSACEQEFSIVRQVASQPTQEPPSNAFPLPSNGVQSGSPQNSAPIPVPVHDPVVNSKPAPWGVNASDPTEENAGCMPIPAVLMGASGAHLSFSGSTSVVGDVYLFKNTSLSMSGSSIISGTIYGDPLSSVLTGSTGVMSPVDLSWETQVQNYSNALANLTPTETLESIYRTHAIVGNGHVNIINVIKSITLTSVEELTLDGTAIDVFVINVHGGISLSGQASIKVGSRVQPQNVVFNVIGAGGGLSLSGSGVITGTFIGLMRNVSLSGTGIFQGSLFVGGLTVSGSGQLWNPVIFCSNQYQY